MSIIYTRKACLPLLLVSLFSSFPAVCRAQAYEPLYEALPPVYNAGQAPPTPVSHPVYIPTEAPAPTTPSPQPLTYESTTAPSTTTESTTTAESTTVKATTVSTTTEINRKPIYKVSFKPNRNLIRTRTPTRLQKPKPEVPASKPKYTPKFKPKKIKTRLPSGPVTRPKYVRPKPKVTTSPSVPTTTTTLPPTTTTLPPTTTTLPPTTTTLPPTTTTFDPTKAPATTVKYVPEYQELINHNPVVPFYPTPGPQYPVPAYPQVSPYPAYPPYSLAGGHDYSEGDLSLKPYSFSYGVKDGHTDFRNGDFGHEEESDGKAVAGSYKVRLPDGRLQTVTYNVQNDSGFLAHVELDGDIKQR